MQMEHYVAWQRWMVLTLAQKLKPVPTEHPALRGTMSLGGCFRLIVSMAALMSGTRRLPTTFTTTLPNQCQAGEQVSHGHLGIAQRTTSTRYRARPTILTEIC